MKNEYINANYFITPKYDGILVEIEPVKGFSQETGMFFITFFDDDTKEIVWESAIKVGQYTVCTRRDINILVQIKYKNLLIYNNSFPKIKNSDILLRESLFEEETLPPANEEVIINKPLVSIVIPTMQLELTKKCVESLIKYTDLNDKEIIIVANGAHVDMKSYVSNLSLGEKIPIRCLWYDNPLGAVPALNAGIREAKGEYVLLLNDDCEILWSEKNNWINWLLAPFSNPKIGCTGPFKMVPMLGSCDEISLSKEDADYGFILFFCALIPKRIFDEMGLLDESLQCGVDIDFCLKLKRNNYLIEQVPTENHLDTSNKTHWTGDFPIWHQAEATVHDFYGLDEWHNIMKKDQLILEERYGTKNKKPIQKISIVIPVYGNHLDDFHKCYDSIINNTDMSNIEIIIIANGCPQPFMRMFLDDITKDDTKSIKYFWFDEALGATKALNEGIKNSSGDIIILLNQDVILLANNWLPMLIDPFENPEIGLTGPMLDDTSNLDGSFILFFCVAIRKKVIDDIGLLDEIFNPGGFEDIDFSIRAERVGWKLLRVPHNVDVIGINEGFQGGFPIYHIEQHGDWMTSETYEKNEKIIQKRYAKANYVREEIEVTWPTAQKKYELKMIQEFLKNFKTQKILEVGTFRGGTAMLWAHMVEPFNGKVYCCDLCFDWGAFNGFGYFGKDNKVYPRQVYDDSPYSKFITEIQGNSHDPLYIDNVFKTVGMVDMLFIDGDHSYEGVKQDFENFYPLVKMGGYILFHDIVGSDFHRANGCVVDEFWNEIKDVYQTWEFIDQNEYTGMPSKSMGIGIIKKDSAELKKKAPVVSSKIIDNSNTNTNSGKDVLCFIATKNRYDSTLPLTLQSVMMQEVKPKKIIIWDDNTPEERRDLRENETYRYIFEFLDMNGIELEVLMGLCKGQHFGHQYVNKLGYKFVWRLDDDEVARPDALKRLLSYMSDDVGGVAGTVLTKGYGGNASAKIEDIFSRSNVQWNTGNEVIEADHLHSTFLYRAGIADYNLELSPVAHREETMFTHDLKEKGYRLIVDQSIVIYHLKQQSTGIRSHNVEWFYRHDEDLFLKKMESWGYKLINLNSGLGDHFAFLNVLPKLQKKYKHIIIGACYPEVFKGIPNINLIDIAQSEPINSENIYKWMIDNNWKESIVKAYEIFYGVS